MGKRVTILAVASETIDHSVILPKEQKGFSHVDYLVHTATAVIAFYQRYPHEEIDVEYRIGKVEDTGCPHPSVIIWSREREKGVDEDYGDWKEQDKLTYMEEWNLDE